MFDNIKKILLDLFAFLKIENIDSSGDFLKSEIGFKEKELFIKELKERGYKWREEGEFIIVSEEQRDVYIDSLKSIPSNVKFNNRGYVYLQSLKLIPDNVQFNNSGDVHLSYLESIPNNVQFRNRGNLYLYSLESIHINLDPEEIFQNEDGIIINGEWTNIKNNIIFPESRWKVVKEMVTD